MLCNDLHTSLSDFISRYAREQICVVADKAVMANHLWTTACADLPCLVLEIDEAHKSLETVQHIWDFFFAQGLTRSGLVICVGGGVLTDIAGFAASTYKRGIDYIAIPTTLLAMVDASSGGKTGINYHGLKNSIGAFAAPIETLICPEWLQTLPAKEMLSGFGEMLKTGLIHSNRLWSKLLQLDLGTMDIKELTPLIDACVHAKEEIVKQDPKESGLRKVLNFGHTFGHALEEISLVEKRLPEQTVLQHSGLLHGYAVVYGLIAELYLSVTRLGCPKEPLQQMTQIMLHYYGKPECKCSDRERLIALMHADKKNERTADINCTLIKAVGSPVINQVITPDDAVEALDYLFSL